MNHLLRRPHFCLCENKGADQLCSYCTADQRLCFCHSDSTTSLLPNSKISSFQPASETVQASLCQTRSETQKTRSETQKTSFLTSLLICPWSTAKDMSEQPVILIILFLDEPDRGRLPVVGAYFFYQ